VSAAAWAQRLWAAANLRRWRRFRAALGDPGRCQRRLLLATLRANAETAFGRRHRFAGIATVEDFRRRVPLVRYDELTPWLDRIRRGEPAVLTRDRVLLLTPSGGSTAAAKLVPFTRALQAEFQRAIGPWVVDLFRRHPGLARGCAYWSLSPAAEPAGSEPEPGAVPVGFADDTAYLAGLFRRLVGRTLAVPAAVSRLADVESFRYATLLHLLRARDLALVSVWHPSFWTLLLEPLARHWERLLEDLAAGTLTPPAANENGGDAAPAPDPDPARAAELRRLGPGSPAAIWPRLAVISCWADGHAAGAAADLAGRFPGVAVEPKGLVATEAFVSLPFAGGRPVAVTSHFFEFLDDAGRPHAVDELTAGGEYSVVVTTGGGLYRYRLGDRVRVEGFSAATPCLRFLGREDRVSDRRGEKLAEGHVAAVLERLLGDADAGVRFAMLAPDDAGLGGGYTLYLESKRPPRDGLAADLERALAANPHYRWCVRLGQLAPARVFRVDGGAHHVYLEHRRRAGQRLGDVKPAALSPESGWSRRFTGRYQPSAAEPAATAAAATEC